MWEIQPGIEFVTSKLLKFNLRPTHALFLARKYRLLDWIPSPVGYLLSSPLKYYTLNGDPSQMLDYELYMVIALAKESIEIE